MPKSPHALLALLLAATAADAAEPVQFVADVPFTECAGLICMQITLDDAAPRSVMLDTGNVNSSLMTDVAQQSGWTLETIDRDGKPIDGVRRAGVHRVQLGHAAGETKFLALDRALFGDNPPPIEGSLAYPFFKDRVLEIDYPRHRLRVSAPLESAVGKAPDAGKLELITFGKSGPPIVVGSPFTVGGKPLRAQIDTGFTGTLLVYDAAIDRLGLRAASAQGALEDFPLTDGGVSLRALPLRTIGFGAHALSPTQQKVYISAAGKNPVHQPDGLFEATVGNALFAHSVLTLDFHAMTVAVRPG